jgi:hypothetical protein
VARPWALIALMATIGLSVWSAISASCPISASWCMSAVSMTSARSIAIVRVTLAVPTSLTILRTCLADTPNRRSIDAHESPWLRAATIAALRSDRSCGFSLRTPFVATPPG